MYVLYHIVNLINCSVLHIVPFGECVVLSEDWLQRED